MDGPSTILPIKTINILCNTWIWIDLEGQILGQQMNHASKREEQLIRANLIWKRNSTTYTHKFMWVSPLDNRLVVWDRSCAEFHQTDSLTRSVSLECKVRTLIPFRYVNEYFYPTCSDHFTPKDWLYWDFSFCSFQWLDWSSLHARQHLGTSHHLVRIGTIC